jgi:predicted DNA-binding protein (MmcQ/YjbR family)
MKARAGRSTAERMRGGAGARAGMVLAKVRAICLSLPEAEETSSWGHPNFRAGRKTFAALEVYEGALCLCFKTSLEEQEMLLNDARYFASPYAGHQGWVSMKTDGRLSWRAIEHHLLGSYRLVALPRMLAALDAAGARPV